MSDESTPSPYEPPLDHSETTTICCPKCRETMEAGDLASGLPIRWQAESASWLSKFLLLGPQLAQFTRRLAYRVPGYFCSNCRILLFRESK